MAPTPLRWRSIATLVLGLCASTFVHATPDDSTKGNVTVLIDGAAYPAQLRENTELLTRLHTERSPSARHYKGDLTGVDGSWIRASDIRGRWEGIVSMAGQRYVVTTAQRDTAGDLVLSAGSVTEAMDESRCASDAPGAQPLAAQLSTSVAEADFATLCTTTVDNVCLLPELDLAFDLQFQQVLGSNFQSQAAALLNIVDGFYTRDLNIQFDALSMTFLTNDLFSTTLVANDLLTDITNKKNSGQVPFVTNPRAILHLVTGRDFSDTTVGISNVGTLCSASNNTGTAQVIRSGGFPSVSLTALVVAHELGHNFNASHDGTGSNTCPASGFIMAPQLSPGATDFSSCSISEITTKINGLSNIQQCFHFPVDASIGARAGNPTNANANENFTLDYDVAEQHASVASTQVSVAGSFSATGGTFVAATANGNACSIASNGQTYTCTTDANGGLIEVTTRVAATTTLTVNSTVSVSPAGGVKDINATNDSASSTVSTSTPPAAPSGLTATVNGASIDLAWQDNSANEDGFRIERRAGNAAFDQIATTATNVTTFSDTSAAAGTTYDYRVSSFGPGGTSTPSPIATAAIPAPKGGGGGGGSFGAELAPLLLALMALRRRGRLA